MTAKSDTFFTHPQNAPRRRKLPPIIDQDGNEVRPSRDFGGGSGASGVDFESAEFQNATPYNKAFYDTMFKVKDFWATPEYAELLIQMNQRIYPYITAGEGTAKEALDNLASDWNATFKKYNRVQN